jgi:polar amino acid transport system permease protein
LKNRFKFTPLDLILLTAIVLAVTYIIIKMKTDLHYKWDWSSVASYIIRYDAIKAGYVPGLLVAGLIVTFK